MRATDGLAGRSYDRGGVVNALNSDGNTGGFRTEPGEHLIAGSMHARKGGGWRPNAEEAASGYLQLGASGVSIRDYWPLASEGPDPLLPIGLDSHRYRCCGNGVVADVAEWIGARLAAIA